VPLCGKQKQPPDPEPGSCASPKCLDPGQYDEAATALASANAAPQKRKQPPDPSLAAARAPVTSWRSAGSGTAMPAAGVPFGYAGGPKG